MSQAYPSFNVSTGVKHGPDDEVNGLLSRERGRSCPLERRQITNAPYAEGDVAPLRVPVIRRRFVRTPFSHLSHLPVFKHNEVDHAFAREQESDKIETREKSTGAENPARCSTTDTDAVLNSERPRHIRAGTRRESHH